MGTYTDAMKRAFHWEFSTDTQPRTAMRIVTKIERVQPYCTGLDAQGRFVWEGRAMPRWQLELLRVPYLGDFMAHWMKRRFEDATGYEGDINMTSMELREKRNGGKKRRAVWGD